MLPALKSTQDDIFHLDPSVLPADTLPHCRRCRKQRSRAWNCDPLPLYTDTESKIDVHDLSIILLSREASDTAHTTTAKGKGTKARAAGLEILSGAHLRIKSGGRYGFVGRNGSGKSSSSLMRACRQGGILMANSNSHINLRKADSSSTFQLSLRCYAPSP